MTLETMTYRKSIHSRCKRNTPQSIAPIHTVKAGPTAKAIPKAAAQSSATNPVRKLMHLRNKRKQSVEPLRPFVGVSGVDPAPSSISSSISDDILLCTTKQPVEYWDRPRWAHPLSWRPHRTLADKTKLAKRNSLTCS
jgi:hypothetical protein